MNPGIQHRDERVGGISRCARSASSNAIEPNCERSAHLWSWQRRPDTAAMGHNQEHLLPPNLFLVQPSVLPVAYLRVRPYTASLLASA
jgi:hypothetical protein